MKRILGPALVLVPILALAWMFREPTPVRAERSGYLIDPRTTLFSGQVLGPSTTVTSTAVNINKSEAQSIKCRAVTAGVAPNVAIEILTSVLDTGAGTAADFALPDTGGALLTLTDQNWHHVALNIPVSSAIKVRMVNNSISVTATMDLTLVAQ